VCFTRDDLTVEVVFFGDNTEKNGEVIVNKEAAATTKNDTPQAKL
jgi:pyruvate dehydrogenase phosphatase